MHFFAVICSRFARPVAGEHSQNCRVRHATNLEELIASETELWYLGDGDKRRPHLERMWLSKRDLVRAAVAEMGCKERHYLNYLTSPPNQVEYAHEAIIRT